MAPKSVIKRLDNLLHKRCKAAALTTKNIGETTEKAALVFLLEQGLKLLESNYYSRYGEIDIVMADDKVIVFIEVRYRKSNAYGGGATSITRNKQQKLIKTANHYLQHHKANVECRFDVIDMSPAELSATKKNQPFHFNWIKNALISI